MPEQAREVLRAGLWGVPPTAQLRMRPRPGDGVLIAVGAPDRVFIGDAVVTAGYQHFTDDEAKRLPKRLAFDRGLSLTRVRVWPRAMPVMAVWPSTVAALTNPRALPFGAITALNSSDAAKIVATSRGIEDLEPEDDAPGVRELSPEVEPVDQGLVGRGTSPVGVELEPALMDHAAELLRAASESSPWLPRRLGHADWGTSGSKCIVATAELDNGIYHAHAPRIVLERGGLLERMRLGHRPGQSTLLGFDFPIGVPRVLGLAFRRAHERAPQDIRRGHRRDLPHRGLSSARSADGHRRGGEGWGSSTSSGSRRPSPRQLLMRGYDSPASTAEARPA
jgi:hypothetical protein